MEEKNGEEDEEEWEDASDSEPEEAVEAGSDSGHDSREEEKKDKEKPAKKSPDQASRPPRSRSTSTGSPREQRTPRPKIHIPPPALAAAESPEGGKPLSPFSPLDHHQPVSDWGEEMELLSPRSSMGGDSPLKPPSTESSPPQRKEQLEEEKEEQLEEEEKDEEEEFQDAPSDQPPEETGTTCTLPSPRPHRCPRAALLLSQVF